MLKLSGITKNYKVGDTEIPALRGISVEFRKHEFVSILGPSGCGKTTLLNIIGGLDRYTDGDMSIAGKHTKKFADSDWDSYRNHSVGFVFQNYNLIPHQSILSNVELALTLTGVSKAERRKRAIEMLNKVGLSDHIYKKPNQLSGGQMQRVAIARALINDPEIILADEPTGALDSVTSVQIMDILRDISKDKLIIMVTHNPDLAKEYSSRIIKLLDGKIVDDTNPYKEDLTNTENKATHKRPSMSFFTALSLSLNNLLSKKARTMLTAVAGSIGIIGIALILSLSSGIQAYIDKVQEDTLSSYPITIEAETVDVTSLMLSMMNVSESQQEHDLDQVYSSTMMADMMNSLISAETTKNNLVKFKKYLESDDNELSDAISAVQYTYDTPLNIYSANTIDGVYQVNPSTVFDDFYSEIYSENAYSSYSAVASNVLNTWVELIPGRNGEPVNDLLKEQYDLVAGSWPSEYNEVVLIITENNEINDIFLYSLGLKDPDEVQLIMDAAMKGETHETSIESWTYEELLNLKYKLVLPSDCFEYDDESGIWNDMRNDVDYMKNVVNQGVDIKVTGIIRPNPDAVSAALTGAVGYIGDLTDYAIQKVESSEIVKQQMADPTLDIISGLPFPTGEETELSEDEKSAAVKELFISMSDEEKALAFDDVVFASIETELNAMTEAYIQSYPDRASMEAELLKTFSTVSGMDEEMIASYLSEMSDEDIYAYMFDSIKENLRLSVMGQASVSADDIPQEQFSVIFESTLEKCGISELALLHEKYFPSGISSSTYENNLKILGYSDKEAPKTINIYASSFENKDVIAEAIAQYNKNSNEEDKINYTDYVALIMSSVSTIIDVISYVLIAFVSISLIVSSIMIGIITYISVLERIKEIGVLRAIGASKGDISRVFNAETLIIGFASGAFGIIVTVLLCIPINIIIQHLSGIANINAYLPAGGGILLVLISMLMTYISGLIPSKIAARMDPVEALRSE